MIIDINFTDDNFITFFEQFEDFENRDKDGLSGLESYFDEIDNANTLDSFSDVFIKVNYDLGLKSFFEWEVIPDLYDNSKNVIVFSPIALEKLSTFLLEESMPSGLEFFTNEKYKSYKDAFEKARVAYFEAYGYDDEKAKDLSNQITEFAKLIQEKSLSLDELSSNYTDYYKNITLSELKSIFKNLPIDKLLAKYNLSNHKYFALMDEGHMKALDNYYTVDHLPLMKEMLKLLILEDVASVYTSSTYANILLNTFIKISGQMLTLDNLFTVIDFINLRPKMLGEYLNVKYDENYFTEIEKQEIIELINKVKDHYVEVINSSNWLSDATKQEALKKISNLVVNVGYVQEEDNSTKYTLVNRENGGSLISNLVIINQNESGDISKTINKKVKLSVDHFKVNAYYNPLNNSINFPSAFREIYRNIKDKYEIYAYVGTIIGHEISHAFDDNGSKYDEKGNLKNWWSEEDKKNFDSLKQKIVDYYSKYEFFGFKVDGAKTVGENIADLAGLKTIISIMESENATNEEFIKFFESYAKLWAEKATKQSAELAMMSDTHSPNKVRVNAVLSSMDKFYEVYDIKEGDKMYVAKEDRVGLW